MKLTVYAFRKNYLDCYESPMFARESIENVCESYRRSILTNPDQAYGAKFQEIQIVELGVFDDFSGKFELLKEPLIKCECAKFFPAGYLAKKYAQENANDA